MKIYHLYSNLLNLYGEYANTLAMRRMAQNASVDCEIIAVQSVADINFKDASVIYVGAGSERALAAAAQDMCANAEPVREYLDAGGFALATGGSGALFCSELRLAPDSLTPVLGWAHADFTAGRRVYGDVLCTSADGQTVAASYNTPFKVETELEPLFSVFYDSADTAGAHEGFRKGNLFVTSLIGPLFQRNPQLCKGFVSLLLPQTLLTMHGFEHALAAHDAITAELKRHCK